MKQEELIYLSVFGGKVIDQEIKNKILKAIYIATYCTPKNEVQLKCELLGEKKELTEDMIKKVILSSNLFLKNFTRRDNTKSNQIKLQTAMYIIRNCFFVKNGGKQTKVKITQISKIFKRHHSSVRNSLISVENRYNHDKQFSVVFDNTINNLKNEFYNNKQ